MSKKPVLTSKEHSFNPVMGYLFSFLLLLVLAFALGGIRYFILSLTGFTLVFFYLVDVAAIIQGAVLGVVAKKFSKQVPVIFLITVLILSSLTAYFSDHYLNFRSVNNELNSLYGEGISFTEYLGVTYSSEQEITRRGTLQIPAYITELAYLLFIGGFSLYVFLKKD